VAASLSFAEYLECRARRNPVTLNSLASTFSVDRRIIEEEVQRLRLEGSPIITDGDGARWSYDPAELRECAARLRSRLINQAKTARALLRTARRLEDRNARPLIFDWSGPQ
jgi:hypothetical protein